MKQKPCKLCELHQKIVVDSNRYTGDTVAKIENNELLISYDSEQAWTGMKAEYCPLCGKKIVKPQVAYYIDRDGDIVSYKTGNFPTRVFNVEQNKAIGNYFETREEAEKAVEKLKAWKRLKDSGLKFKDWRKSNYDGTLCINAEVEQAYNVSALDFFKDLRTALDMEIEEEKEKEEE